MSLEPRLVRTITPSLKMELRKSEWKYIPTMLSEAYYTNENGKELITVRPNPAYENTNDRDIAYQFSALNGTCEGIEFWSVVKKKGKLL